MNIQPDIDYTVPIRAWVADNDDIPFTLRVGRNAYTPLDDIATLAHRIDTYVQSLGRGGVYWLWSRQANGDMILTGVLL